jgi:hypothetical protein
VAASPVGNADTETLAKVAAFARVFCFQGCLVTQLSSSLRSFPVRRTIDDVART